jgi:hypothetical protein
MHTSLYREYQRWASHEISNLGNEPLADPHDQLTWLSTIVKKNTRSSIQLTLNEANVSKN